MEWGAEIAPSPPGSGQLGPGGQPQLTEAETRAGDNKPWRDTSPLWSGHWGVDVELPEDRHAA